MITYLSAAVRGGVCVALLSFSHVAHAEWWEAETSHFIVTSESNKEDVEAFASRLERFDNALRHLQGMPVPGPDVGEANKVKVYRFGDTDDIAQLAGDTQSGIAGFYIPRAGNAVSFVPARQNFDQRSVDQRTTLTPEGVLKHEYVHHFMLQKFNTSYPHWYVEGFAELYGTIELLDDGSFRVGNVPQHRRNDLLELPDVKLTKLLDHKKKLTGMEVYQSYSFGWMLAHYLNFNKDRQGQLPAYLKALNAGEDSLTAAQRIFGDLDVLQKQLYKYKNGPFPGYEVKPANYVEPKVTMRRLPAGEEAVIRAHIRSEVGVNPRQARSVASDVRGKDAAYPDNLPVQLMVGEAYNDAREFGPAEATLKRALKIDPESAEANILMGGLFVARAEKEKNPALYAQARPWFAEAYRIDPKDPRGAVGYYMTYYEAKEAVPEAALIALESVFDYSSYDNGYRMVLARQLLDENKGKAAREVLAPLAFSFHKQDEANKIAKVVEEIDAGKVTEARATMAAIFAEQKKKAEN